MQSESVNRLSRKNKRGVSPIIATILLVAITVVLAAVLYILVTGLLTHTSTTSSIGMSAGTPAQCKDTAATPNTENTYPVTIASTTSTITTANFGLKVVPAGSSTPTPPATSTSSATTGTCPGASPGNSGWVAVLQSASGSNEAVFDAGGAWTTTGITCTGTCPTLPVTISGGMTIIVVSNPTLTQASLQVYGLGGASISGSETI